MIVLLLALGAGVAAGPALGQTAGVDLTGDTDGDATVADADAGVTSGNTDASASTGSGNGNAGTAGASNEDTAGTAEVGWSRRMLRTPARAARAASASAAPAHPQAGRPPRTQAAVDPAATGRSGASRVAERARNRGRSGPRLVRDARERGGSRTANGDTAGGATVGCVVANAGRPGSQGAARAGLCRSASSAPGPGGGPLPGGGNGGRGGAGEPANGSGSPSGVLAAASGNLPFTGLPLWAVALTGLGLIGLGVRLRRGRAEAAPA
jgi:hypothetical protein